MTTETPGTGCAFGRVDVVSLVDGRLVYAARCRCHRTGGVADSADAVIAAVAQAVPLLCRPVRIGFPRHRNERAVLVRKWGDDRADQLLVEPDFRVEVPSAYCNPYIVAADASLGLDGICRWAAVTGAGWVRIGSCEVDRSRGGSTLGELIAITEALRFFPTGSVVQPVVDNKAVLRVLTTAIEHLQREPGRTARAGRNKRRRQRPRLLAQPWLRDVRELLFAYLSAERTMIPIWGPRDQHDLIQIADGLTRSDAQRSQATLQATLRSALKTIVDDDVARQAAPLA